MSLSRSFIRITSSRGAAPFFYRMGLFLRKHNRLRLEKEINHLFLEGESIFIYPIKLIYVRHNAEDFSFKVMTAVSKKYLKRAVKRNLVRRRIKEAFRQSPHRLRLASSLPRTELHLAFMYVSKEVLGYPRIDEVVNELLDKLIRRGERGTKSV